MKVLIIGSMKFVRDMIKIKKALGKLGHKAMIPFGAEPHLKNKNFVDSLEENLIYCIENDVMRENFVLVAKNDAVLVVNKKRNNTEGYIGVSALMEMAIAHYLKKKIYLLRPTPHFNDARWAHEVAIMQPVVLGGDLTKVK